MVTVVLCLFAGTALAVVSSTVTVWCLVGEVSKGVDSRFGQLEIRGVCRGERESGQTAWCQWLIPLWQVAGLSSVVHRSWLAGHLTTWQPATECTASITPGFLHQDNPPFCSCSHGVDMVCGSVTAVCFLAPLCHPIQCVLAMRHAASSYNARREIPLQPFTWPSAPVPSA